MVVGIEARAIARGFLKLSHGANHGQNSCQSWQKLDTQPKSATETACSGKYTNPRYGLETRTHARSSSKSCTRTRCFTEADKSVALRNFKVGICLCPHRHKPPPLLLLERSPARVQPGLNPLGFLLHSILAGIRFNWPLKRESTQSRCDRPLRLSQPSSHTYFCMENSNGTQNLPLLRRSLSTPPTGPKPNLLLIPSLPTGTTPSLATQKAAGRPLLPRKPAGRAARLARTQPGLLKQLQSQEPAIRGSKPRSATRQAQWRPEI